MKPLSPAVLLVTLALAPSGAQQPAEEQPQPMPLVMNLISGFDDPALVAELKLSAEQVKALVARRQAEWDEQYVLTPKKFRETDGPRVEATVAVIKKALTAEQYKRAVQLGAQRALEGGGGPPGRPEPERLSRVPVDVLRAHPELVDAFKLTAEQKKALTAPPAQGERGPGDGTAVELTKDQQAAAKEFLGPPARERWEDRTDPRVATPVAHPDGFRLLAAGDVRTDLKLTAAETKAVLALTEKWNGLDESSDDVSPKDDNARRKALRAEGEKVLAALTPDQRKRLKQIEFRARLGRGRDFDRRPGPNADFVEQLFGAPEVRKELGLTDEQSRAVAALRAKFRKDAAAVLASADAAADAEKRLEELAAARQAAAAKVLMPEQAAKVEDLGGAPFTGSTAADGRRPAPVDPPPEVRRAATFGRYTTELTILAALSPVQDELKMSPEQVKAATAAAREVTGRLPLFPTSRQPVQHLDDRSAAVDAALRKLLTADQAKRFREIMLQACEKAAGDARVPSAVAYPGVAEAVKLTDDQKRKLLAGAAPAEVLSDTQKGAVRERLGAPVAAPALAADLFGLRLAPEVNPASDVVRSLLSTNTKTEEALKLTASQAKMLNVARNAYRAAVRAAQPAGSGGFGPVPPAVFEGFEKTVLDLLTAEQKDRFAQLALQYEAAANLAAVLLAPATAKRLELTKDQTAKIAAVDAANGRLFELRDKYVPPVAFGTADELGAKMRDAADERLLAVLTDAQKKVWRELTGEPLTGVRKTVPGGFGRGGFGGGPIRP